MQRTEYTTLDDDANYDVTSCECLLCCCKCLLKQPESADTMSGGGEEDSPARDLCDLDAVDAAAFSAASSVETALQTLQMMVAGDGDVNSSFGLGRLHFSVFYDFNKRSLNVSIDEAENLPAKDANGTSDPYVKVFMLPAKRHKLTTHVQHKTLNPRWNEAFVFEGYAFEKVINNNLCLQVFDHDRFSRDDIIGEVILPMTPQDLVNGLTLWKDLQPSQRHMGELGELSVSLCYDSTRSCLSVTVNSARNLKSKDLIGSSDPYVKIWLTQGGRRVEKKKTAVLKRTLNPRFDETLMFHVSIDQVRYTSLAVHVMDFDRIGRNEEIGRIVLGSRSGPTEKKHWNEMLANARLAVTKWHLLRYYD